MTSLFFKTSPQFESRAQASLLGLALGDALGTTLEFKNKDSYQPLSDMVGGGPFNLKAGEWTDDTSMALCLADSLLAKGRHCPADQMDRYLRWKESGENSVTGSCFDIGNTVAQALSRYQKNGNANAGSSEENSAGNGSLMRLAPVAIFYSAAKGVTIETAVQMAAESSITTHAEVRCIEACQVTAWLLYHLFAETYADKNALFAALQKNYPLPLSSDISAVVQGSFINKTREQIYGSGFVVQSLEAALWCFAHSDNFEQGALLAANLGDDADTTAAVFGQIAGAYYDLNGLPEHWLEKLAWYAKLLQSAELLAACPLHSHSAAFIREADKQQEKLLACGAEKLGHEFTACLYPAFYDYGFILNWDWSSEELPGYAQHVELYGEDNLELWLAQADYITCLKFITRAVRGDRFCNGLLTSMSEAGSITAWLRRLTELTDMYQGGINYSLHSGDTKQLLFIGDVHGQYKKLNDLLTYAGFVEHDPQSAFSRAKVVFVGDLIDNQNDPGADHLNTLKQVKRLCDTGLACCVMGNHEFNAVGWTLKKRADKQGNSTWARAHSDKNQRQHALFLEQTAEDSAQHKKWINWFKTLPLFMDFGEVRCIHACWKQQTITRLLPYLNADNSLKERHWNDAFDPAHELYELCETLLKGPEIKLPPGHRFIDKGGCERSRIRVSWWQEQSQTYRGAAQVAQDQLANIPEQDLPGLLHNESQTRPVVVGHYTLSGMPQVLSDKVVCVDYNAAEQEGDLVGYLFDLNEHHGEMSGRVTNENFIYVNQPVLGQMTESGIHLLIKNCVSELPAFDPGNLDNRTKRFCEQVSSILYKDWDPVGIYGEAGYEAEYSVYEQDVVRLGMFADKEMLAGYLCLTQTYLIGRELEKGKNNCARVAHKIKALLQDNFAANFNPMTQGGEAG
ncbi:ADP-ribosylglycohydrolase family protein [Psychromonas aquimarina]|uniref:ADP-ribosylglycohydrolase family protein n=1 Tax=Psychromonas aquimarina TaxID=444919 RepID=UPI00040E36DD|nr:ADP-ribosylglycohydrolase family protein [Psychromonas aquimarina]